MENSMLSIIVPVYHVKPYLEQCVRSLLAQTYENLEVLLIDDGSQDGSGELCDLLAAEDSRILVIHQENRGVSAARNAGLRAAKGAYIGFVDADDWIEPEMYQSMISLMEADGSDAAFCGYWEDYEQAGIPPVVHSPALTGHVDQSAAVYQCIIGTDAGYYIIGCNKCFRRKAVWQNGSPVLFPENITRSEDELWLSHVLQSVSSASLTNQPFYHWRIRAASASHVLRSDNAFRQVLEAHKESAALFAKCGWEELAMGRVYDTMFRYVWLGYYTGDRENERYFRTHLKPYRKVFWKCREFSLKRKVKFFLVDWMCLLGLPRDWVTRLEQATSK